MPNLHTLDQSNHYFFEVVEPRHIPNPFFTKSDQQRHVYKHNQGGAFNFSVIGCQGDNSREKTQIADNIVLDKPRAIIGLGDSFYHYGVTQHDDPLFKTHFEQDYSRDTLRMISFFSVLGNHDMNFQKFLKRKYGEAVGGSATPYDRMMAQVERSYLDFSEKKNWNMMFQYYVLTTDYANIFFLNSNLLPFDELGQQAWLEDTYRLLNPPETKKWNIIAMHHPLNSPGKRYLKSDFTDLDQYDLPEFAIKRKEYTDRKYKSMNEILYSYFISLFARGIHFELFLGAHDHLLAAMWQRKDLPQSWQIISGAAGDPRSLQDIHLPVDQRRPLDKDDFGKDFYSSESGHVHLNISSPTLLTWHIKNLRGQAICSNVLQRGARNTIKCIMVK